MWRRWTKHSTTERNVKDDQSSESKGDSSKSKGESRKS